MKGLCESGKPVGCWTNGTFLTEGARIQPECMWSGVFAKFLRVGCLGKREDAEGCPGEEESFETGDWFDEPTESAAGWAAKDGIRLGAHRDGESED